MMRKLFLVLGCFIGLVAFAQDIDVLHYRFVIRLDDRSDSIDCLAEIKVLQKKKASALYFDLTNVQPNGKGMKVYRVEIDPAKPTYRQENEKLIIPVGDRRPGDTSTVSIWYRGIPNDGLIISKNKYGDRTFFADNWPNRAHNWIPCIDKPDDKASFEFVVDAPSSYKIVSNGVKVQEGHAEEGRTITNWKENTPLPTKVMVIGAAKFAVKTFADSPPNIPVSAWVYQQDSAKGFHDYAPAPTIVKFFSNYIAPFPYEKLANVQSKTIFGGMENASAIFYFEGSVTGKGGVEDLLAHEIAHQWFGDMASEKSFTHLWLSEGFATYFTDIYWQHTFGDDAFRKRLQKERDRVIQFVKTDNHPVVDSLSSYMDLLNANSYQKGAWVLHMLRNEVGDSGFHEIIRAYYQQYKGGNADTRDFEKVAEKVSGKDLTWFFDQWLYRPGIPRIKVLWKEVRGKVSVTVEQLGTVYRFPLEIGFHTGSNKLAARIIISKEKETFDLNMLNSESDTSFSLDPFTNLLFEGTISQVK